MIIVNRLEQTKAARSWVFSYPTDTISPKQMQARWCKDHCCGVDKNSGTVYRKITSWANLQVVFINNKNLFHNFINHYLKNSVNCDLFHLYSRQNMESNNFILSSLA